MAGTEREEVEGTKATRTRVMTSDGDANGYSLAALPRLASWRWGTARVRYLGGAKWRWAKDRRTTNTRLQTVALEAAITTYCGPQKS